MTRERREVLALVLLAVLLRLVHLAAVLPTPVFQYHRTFEESDMFLFDDWARRIEGGDVLGRDAPHFVMRWQTSLAPRERWLDWYGPAPVFFKAPFYAYLVAGLRALFGDAMLPLALLQIAVSAVTLVLLVRVGEDLVGPRAARLGGLLFAVYGPAIHFDTVMLRGPWIQFAALAVVWLLQRLRDRPGWPRAAALGLGLGAALLVNEGFLLLPVLTLLAVAAWVRDRRVLPLSAGVLLGLGAALAPLVARNVAVGAPPLALATTGALAFAQYNSALLSPNFYEAQPAIVTIMEQGGGRLLPTIAASLRTFAGPLDLLRFYVVKGLGFAIPFENPDNVSYYYVQLKDPLLAVLPGHAIVFPLVAAGFACVRRWRALWPLAPAALTLFLSTYLTQVFSRFRVTLFVLLLPLAGLALERLLGWARERRWRPLAASLLALAALAVVLSQLQARVVFQGRPAGEFLYRGSEFHASARDLAERGAFAAARQEMTALVARNPDVFTRATSLLTLANLHLGTGDTAGARAQVESAARLGTRDPVVLTRVGDAYDQLLQDPAAALGAYRAAEAIAADPRVRQALAARIGGLQARYNPPR
jgi:4-amino-4-deoxy-L-arabinose transferase-like glycosyltransferase